MVKKLIQICFLLFALVAINSLTNCHKTSSFEISGRVIDTTSKQPLSVKLELKGNDPSSAKNTADHLQIKTITTGNDGTFDIKFSSKSGQFYLYINGRGSNKNGYNGFGLSKNQNTDIGDIWVQ